MPQIDHSRILAENLYSARQRRKLTQEELARQSGIPRSTITHLETGSANPSLKTLTQLTQVLKISLEELLTPSRSEVQLFEEEQIPFRVKKNGVGVQLLLPEKIPGLEFERMELEPRARLKGTPHRSGTREYFYCAKGKIAIYVDRAQHVVKAGQLLAFPGDLPHAYENLNTSVSWGIGVVALN